MLKFFKMNFLAFFLVFNAQGQEHGKVLNHNTIEKNNEWFGEGLTKIGDLNGDNITDIAVGGSEDFNNEVYVLMLDTNGGIKSQSLITSNFNEDLEGESDFGNSVTNIGDINQDGINDIAIGAPGISNGKGSVWLIYLNRKGNVKNYTQISDTSNIGSNLQQGDNFGWSVGALPDINGNGINELIVGSPDKGKGHVWILYIGEKGNVTNSKKFNNASQKLSGKIESFGSACSNLKDLNKDNNPELVVGANRDNDGGQDKGALWILFLNDEVSLKRVQKISSNFGNFQDSLGFNSLFGTSITRLGDLNGDSVEDLAVGAIGEQYNDSQSGFLSGKVWILFLNQNGQVKSSQAIGNELGNFQDTLKTGDRFGMGVENIGDLNGDKVPELAVGTPGEVNDNRGKIFILFLEGVPQTTGIEMNQPVKRLKAYPNPVKNNQNLKLQLSSAIEKSTPVKVTIYDMQGRQVHEKHFKYQGQPEVQISLPDVASGTYQLYLKAGAFQGFSKVVVQ